ncbi:discoidin domain-containing protein [Paenibacillus beijingensis]|uniref:F5/8 type C domain-containing protein n=1 Tax=Paenibacillus beijingensis TaxID=1126833 RepID=A0A0D5NKZ0_9BACL|nr:discoidin domain-containing protein [Paenibacillus beijingensis]AJY75603.1 hypothetical protein VN24_14860 [Paenibacillus beijingensis]
MQASPVVNSTGNGWDLAVKIDNQSSLANMSGGTVTVQEPAKDLSATAYTKRDSEYLYMAVRMTDNTHFNNNPAGDSWKGDSIQFAIDPGRSIGPGDLGWNENGIALNSDTNTVMKTGGIGGNNLAHSPVAIQRSGSETFYELAIKWTDILPSGMTDSDVTSAGYTITGLIGGTVPQSQMTATASSTQEGDTPASNAIDGSAGTFWDSQYSPGLELPQWITLDLGGTYKVNKVRYLPRGSISNRRILTYIVYVSTDDENFTKVADNGTWANDAAEKTAEFAETTTHVRQEALTTASINANIAELNVDYE